MTSVGPVCHIPPEHDTLQPGPKNIPAIPPAGPTIASLVQTVNTMRQVIIMLTNQQARQSVQRWTEANRTSSKVKIYDPNDKSVFVEVEQINSLTMQDGVTGETWSWKR